MASSAQVTTALTANDAVGKSLQALQVSIAKQEAATATQTQHATDATTQAQADATAVTAATQEAATGLTDAQAKQQALDAAMTALSS